jgi:putative phosphoribosyl transferase
MSMDTRTKRQTGKFASHSVRIAAGPVTLEGERFVPAGAVGIVLFAHGSGSSRHSPRNQAVARALQDSGLGTLLFDLLTREEEVQDTRDGHLRFNIGLLAQRLVAATRWVARLPQGQHLGIGYFGSSTGGAAALVAAAELGPVIDAVVSRGGRPDLAGGALAGVEAPTLLIVGEQDDNVLQLNEEAFKQLPCKREIAVVPRATHLFEEPGALEEVSRLAAAWFRQHVKSR